MRLHRLAFTGTAALLLCGCADAPGPVAPASPVLAAQAAQAAQQVDAAGRFDAIVDFSTLTLTPRGQNCLLEVSGQLVFTGTLEGTATGRTSALVFATCEEVAAAPGTHPDIFRSELAFEGTVNGEPVEATGWYMGRSTPEDGIDGRLVLHGDVRGELDVAARIAVGGEYRGSIVVR